MFIFTKDKQVTNVVVSCGDFKEPTLSEDEKKLLDFHFGKESTKDKTVSTTQVVSFDQKHNIKQTSVEVPQATFDALSDHVLSPSGISIQINKELLLELLKYGKFDTNICKIINKRKELNLSQYTIKPKCTQH